MKGFSQTLNPEPTLLIVNAGDQPPLGPCGQAERLDTIARFLPNGTTRVSLGLYLLLYTPLLPCTPTYCIAHI